MVTGTENIFLFRDGTKPQNAMKIFTKKYIYTVVEVCTFIGFNFFYVE